MKAYLRAIRLERWPRSTAVYIGTAALLFLDKNAFSVFSPVETVIRLAGSFFLTWLISTANYAVNEVADAPFDIHHPTKRFRPLAAGEVSRIPLLGLGAVFAAAALALSLKFYTVPFFYSLASLLAAGFVYNLKPVRAKDIPFLDSVSESINNPIRFCIGWYALAPAVFPPWSLLIAWWAFGNFLMVAKRLSEFRLLGDRAGDYRASLSKYNRTSLLIGMTASAAVFFAAYAYFAAAFGMEWFFYLSPFLAFYFYLFLRKTLTEKEVMEEPEILLIHPGFALYTLLLAALFLLAFLKYAGR